MQCNTGSVQQKKEMLDFGAYVKDEKIVIKDADGSVCDLRCEELQIPGSHSLENALAACAIAHFAGIDADVIAKVLREFQGVEHRIELCNEIDGIRFVNDSKGTNPDAAIRAIEAMKRDIILIAGGYDKGASFDEFISAFDGKVKALVLLGKTATKIKETAEEAGFTNTVILKDMEACVREAYRLAESGDVVLLSPACASWDMYPALNERGAASRSVRSGTGKVATEIERASQGKREQRE